METESEGKGGASGSIDFQALPEGCIANILLFTTPGDVCRLSLVSKTFCSAAELDAVWLRFLPPDYDSIVSRSASASLLASSSKKGLYFTLCDHPIIIDEGKKSFQLEKRSGKKCYMLAARDLSIIWGSTPQYWNWTTPPESRFQEVAELVEVCWLEIRGKIKTCTLSSDTLYAAYLVFKMIDAYGFRFHPVELSVGIYGGQGGSKNVCLDPDLDESQLGPMCRGLQRPEERSDGWLEIEMGEFFNSGVEDDEVEMSVMETKGGNWKHGLFLQGIESFQLEKRSGKKCCMIAARDLTIIWGSSPEYWNWITLPESRFQEVAELVDVCWLEIRGRIETLTLSSDTLYAAYLVFKMVDAYGFDFYPVELSVGINGGQGGSKIVCLDPDLDESELEPMLRGLQRPKERSDGWLEIELGEFFNSGVEDDEVEMSVMETKGRNWKHGLFLQGIEVRPKENN